MVRDESMSSYYNAFADELAKRYERLDFEDVHATLVDQLPKFHARILDVGAGSGRDAAALAGRDHHVVAVEPACEMLRRARKRHKDPRIRWLDDALPGLEKVYSLGEKYDLVLLSAVWMHVPPTQRDRAMRKLTGLMRPGAKLVISLCTVRGDRTDMWEAVPARLIEQARRHGMEFVRESRSRDLFERNEVAWTTLLFRAPDDGTSALPILRNIIANDSKYTTYKFALLRVLLRIAASAPGMIRSRDDGFVDVPMGLVALYWLRAYEPLLKDGFKQSPQDRYAFAGALEDFRQHLSPYDLHVGSRFGGTQAQVVHSALKQARRSITSDGPVRHITYANSKKPIFSHQNARTPGSVSHVDLSREYLWGFGCVTIPDVIFEAMSRHWVWIEPSVCTAWLDKMRRLENDIRPYKDYVAALRWRGEDPRDTTEVAAITERLAKAGSPIARGVWTGRNLRTRSDFEVDHCIPYSRWYNNSLWNLLPTIGRANQSKGDRLPSMTLMTESRERITDWWRAAFTERDQLEVRFIDQAEASLPGLTLKRGDVDVQEVFDAVTWQVGRIRRDQQIAEWHGLG